MEGVQLTIGGTVLERTLAIVAPDGLFQPGEHLALPMLRFAWSKEESAVVLGLEFCDHIDNVKGDLGYQ